MASPSEDVTRPTEMQTFYKEDRRWSVSKDSGLSRYPHAHFPGKQYSEGLFHSWTGRVNQSILGPAPYFRVCIAALARTVLRNEMESQLLNTVDRRR